MIHQLFKIFTWMGSEWVLLALIALSLITGAVILQRWFEIRKLMKISTRFWDEQIESWFRSPQPKAWRSEIDKLKVSYPCLETETLDVIVRSQENGSDDVEKVVDAYLEQRRLKLEKYVGILGTIGSNAPFIGLLGTVLGIIRAFHDMSVSGMSSGMESISGGIAEALVATAVGLMVAIPAVVFFNILNKRISILLKRSQSVSSLVLGQGKQK